MRIERSLRRLNRMHTYTHNRFHRAEGKYIVAWLEVRTKIQRLICEIQAVRQKIKPIKKGGRHLAPPFGVSTLLTRAGRLSGGLYILEKSRYSGEQSGLVWMVISESRVRGIISQARNEQGLVGVMLGDARVAKQGTLLTISQHR